MKQCIENIATGKYYTKLPGLDCYGLLDYVVLSNVPFGAEALFKLGYRACHAEFSDRCYVSFYHPNSLNAVHYEDINGHDFCKMWKKLK